MDMDRCVCCGRYVPEGSMVCSYCIQDNVDRSAEFKRVIHGYWQPNVARKRRKDPMAFCSNCNYSSDIAHKYCPNCGATMDTGSYSVVYVFPKIPPKGSSAYKKLTYEE